MIGGRNDVTSQEARAIHKSAQQLSRRFPDHVGPHDEVECWCCCFQCNFDHAAVIANDKALGVQSVY